VPSNSDLLEPEYEKNFAYLEELLGRKPLEEEVVAYTIFPGPVEDYMRRNELSAGQPEESFVVDAKPAREPAANSAPKMQSANMKTYLITVGSEEYKVELEEVSQSS
jgi:hypothetical protein